MRRLTWASAGSRALGYSRLSRVSSHHEVGDAEGRQRRRKDQLMSHSQRRRELVDQYDDGQDHRPPEIGHSEKDHRHHEGHAASKAAEAIADASHSGTPHQVEWKRTV